MTVKLLTSSTRTPDGLTLHLEGTGVPRVLMIHGLGYASWEVQSLRDCMGEDSGLWSLDNRGTGLSETNESPISIPSLAADAALAVESLGGPLTIIGHSMGGYIAQTLARSRPELVRALVLMGTSSGGAGTEPVPHATTDAWAQARGLSPTEYARRTMPLSFREGWPEQHPDEFEHLLGERATYPTSAEVWQRQFEAAQQFLTVGSLCDFAAPTLIIHGSADRVVPVANGRQLALHLPHAEYHELSEAGHLLHLEQPQLVADLITTFISHQLP